MEGFRIMSSLAINWIDWRGFNDPMEELDDSEEVSSSMGDLQMAIGMIKLNCD